MYVGISLRPPMVANRAPKVSKEITQRSLIYGISKSHEKRKRHYCNLNHNKMDLFLGNILNPSNLSEDPFNRDLDHCTR